MVGGAWSNAALYCCHPELHQAAGRCRIHGRTSVFLKDAFERLFQRSSRLESGRAREHAAYVLLVSALSGFRPAPEWCDERPQFSLPGAVIHAVALMSLKSGGQMWLLSGKTPSREESDDGTPPFPGRPSVFRRLWSGHPQPRERQRNCVGFLARENILVSGRIQPRARMTAKEAPVFHVPNSDVRHDIGEGLPSPSSWSVAPAKVIGS